MRINIQIRLTSLLCEFNEIFCVTETRAATQDSQLSGGHRLIESYGDGSNIASGIAILVQKSFVTYIRRRFAIDDRVMAIGINIHKYVFLLFLFMYRLLDFHCMMLLNVSTKFKFYS